jgi:hypothetical protein
MTRHQMLQHFALPRRKGVEGRTRAGPADEGARTRSARAALALAALTLAASTIAQLLPSPRRSATDKEALQPPALKTDAPKGVPHF